MTDMGCDCGCVYDYDPADVYEVTWPRAAKSHVCCECGADIERGECHEYVSGLWDGHWTHFRTCQACVNIRKDVCPCGFLHEGLREAVWDLYGVDYVTGVQGDDDD
jgi:hypothetical protein